MQNGSSHRPMEEILPCPITTDPSHSPLHEAAIAGNFKQLQQFLRAGVDRNAKDPKHGNTPLHEAAWRGYSKCVKELCALPKPSKEFKEPKSKQLKNAVQNTHGTMHSSLLGTRNSGGFSALHLAAQNGHNQSCREILLAGGDPDVQNNYGDTPLHTACRYGHAGATRILLSAKCDPLRTQQFNANNIPPTFVDHQSQSVLHPEREKLLSSRKFGSHFDNDLKSHQHMMGSSYSIDQVQLERDLNNDSGYSTKVSGSIGSRPSPSLSGQTDVELSKSRDMRRHCDGYYVSGNIGASSLV